MSGNVAYVARLVISRGSGLRARSWSTSTDSTPIATAGAGPSSAIASTMAMNDPETRCVRCCSARKSLPMASASSTRNSSGGCQSSVVESIAATTHEATRTTASPATKSVDRLDNS